MSLSIRLGNLLYKNAFPLYSPLYTVFKKRQDAFEIALLKRFVKPGTTVLDIGANIGFYAKILSRLTGPRGRVICLEPDPVNFSHLQSATRRLGNVEILRRAAGPKTEEITFYLSPELNVDHRTYKPEHNAIEQKVMAVRVDELVKDRQVDVIKMDIQGFEAHAIEGMQETLQKNENVILLSEFWPFGLRQAGSSAVKYFSQLTGSGFHCYLAHKNRLELLNPSSVEKLAADPREKYYNILATRKHVQEI